MTQRDTIIIIVMWSIYSQNHNYRGSSVNLYLWPNQAFCFCKIVVVKKFGMLHVNHAGTLQQALYTSESLSKISCMLKDHFRPYKEYWTLQQWLHCHSDTLWRPIMIDYFVFGSLWILTHVPSMAKCTGMHCGKQTSSGNRWEVQTLKMGKPTKMGLTLKYLRLKTN